MARYHRSTVLVIGLGRFGSAVALELEKAAMAVGSTSLGRIGDCEHDIGRAAVFLASEDASYMMGQTIYPDGGRMALNYTV